MKKIRSHLGCVKLNNGFTLMEMLVVLGVLAIFGVIFTQIFVRSLTGSYKSQILSAIKQNGQLALETMDKNIRGADAVICPILPATTSSATSDTLVVVKSGVYTRYRFVSPTPSVNGYLAQDTPAVDPLDPGSFCPDTALLDPPTTTIITDNQSSYTGNKIGVSVIGDPPGSGFRRETQAGSKDLVVISFLAGPGIQTPQAISSQIEPVRFTTTIELR